MTLAAFARSYRSISSVGRALSSKPAGRSCCCRSTWQTGGRTDARPLRRPWDADSVDKHYKLHHVYSRSRTTTICRVGQKTKLLILSEYVNKTWNILRYSKCFMFKYSTTVLITSQYNSLHFFDPPCIWYPAVQYCLCCGDDRVREEADGCWCSLWAASCQGRCTRLLHDARFTRLQIIFLAPEIITRMRGSAKRCVRSQC